MKRVAILLLMQCFSIWGFSQAVLKGTVKSESGEALTGASVLLKNTYQGVITNPKGEFEFSSLKSGNYLLTVSFIGYETSQMEVSVPSTKAISVVLKANNIMTEEVMVEATRAKNKIPVAYSSVEKSEIRDQNVGQDIPYLLSLTPSFVATSDAGAGVGYTNFRIRGTDLNRINVTINGIPMNDAESQGTFWVDLPDLAASTDNIQVQRGVGTSTNGAAAFGATINLQTNTINKDAYAEYAGSGGSFNTFRNSVSVGTGLLDGKFTIDARLSKIGSDGFIDRASSDLKSYFVSAAWYSEKSILKANIFSGFEETYQAWNGVPLVRLNNDEAGMKRYLDHWLWSSSSERENEIRYNDMIHSDNRTYNMYSYKDEVDHYQQDYYQLFFSHKFNPYLNLNAALHYTYGRGYYENYKYDKKYSKFNLTGPTDDAVSDFVVRKWLDNDFYGSTFSLNYSKDKSNATFGGGYSEYDGDHFGRIIWMQNSISVPQDYEWYHGTGLKKDFNLYGKYNYQLSQKLNLYADLQYRHISYEIGGIDDDLRNIAQNHKFDFFNPKFGLFYQLAANQEAYVSFARANREPNRDNYIDADPTKEKPTYETLNDWELGYNYKTSNFKLAANLYYMSYNDQLILTGQINDVGAPIMINVDDSYRAGIELQAAARLCKKINWNITATFSQNKIKNFVEYVDDWDNGGQQSFDLGKTELAFSPNVVANSQLQFAPCKNIALQLISSYVGKQYIDNSESDERKLDAYFVNHLRVDYTVKQKAVKELKFHLMVNNLFNTQYATNAWVYSYIYGGSRYAMDGYFPQAGTHFFIGVNIKL